MLQRLKDIKDEVKELRNDLLDQQKYLNNAKSKELKKFRKSDDELIHQLDKIIQLGENLSLVASDLKKTLLEAIEEDK